MQPAEPVSNERLSRNTAGTTDFPRYAFTARRLLGDTGLYDYRTRTYAPVLGRFLQRDSIGVWGDPANLGNGYAYVGGDPVNRGDAWGMEDLDPDFLEWDEDRGAAKDVLDVNRVPDVEADEHGFVPPHLIPPIPQFTPRPRTPKAEGCPDTQDEMEQQVDAGHYCRDQGVGNLPDSYDAQCYLEVVKPCTPGRHCCYRNRDGRLGVKGPPWYADHVDTLSPVNHVDGHGNCEYDWGLCAPAHFVLESLRDYTGEKLSNVRETVSSKLLRTFTEMERKLTDPRSWGL